MTLRPLHTHESRRLVSEMAETVKHKQIPVYFDQMVDDVFLNGIAKAQAEAAKPATPAQQVAALPPVSVPKLPHLRAMEGRRSSEGVGLRTPGAAGRRLRWVWGSVGRRRRR